MGGGWLFVDGDDLRVEREFYEGVEIEVESK